MTTLTAQRDADRRYTFSPSSGFTFADLTPLMKIWLGEGNSETPALTVTLTPTGNGSSFVPYSSSLVLTLDKADLAALPEGELYYDITLTDGTGFENALCGGSFELYEDGSEGGCGGCEGGVLTFNTKGQCVTIVLQGGSLAVGASISLAALNAAVAQADASAASAAASAASVAGIPVAFAAPTGSGLIGYIATGVGAIARTILAKLRGWPDVRDYGATGDGVTDDTAAVVAALTAATGGRVFAPPGTYRILSAMNIPGDTKLYGAGRSLTVFRKQFNGNFGTLNDGAGLEDVGFDLQGATYTGRGFTIAGGNQTLRNVNINNGEDACIYFPNGTGSRFHAQNVQALRVGSSGGVGKYAVVFDPTLQAAGQTVWIDFKSGGAESFDFGGANNCLIVNSALFDCIWNANSRDISISNCRMAGTQPYVLKGSGAIIGGGVAQNITVDLGGVFNVSPAYTNGEIFDNSGGTAVVVQHKIQSYNPVLKAGGVPITLGTGGSYTGRYSRSGKLVTVNVRVIWGTGATIPAGAFTLTLPTGAVGADLAQHCVNGRLQPTSGTTYPVYGSIPATGSEAALTVLSGGAILPIDNATPSALGDGTSLNVTFSYQT